MHLISGKISFLLNHHRNHCHNFYTDTPWILDSAYQPQLRVGGYDSFDARRERVQKKCKLSLYNVASFLN